MTKSLRTLLATVAGVTASVLAFYLTATLLTMFLQWLAGDATIFQEIYRDFDANPVFLLLRAAVALYMGVIAFRLGWKYFGKFGIPGVLAPYSEAVGEKPIAVRVFVNGQDEMGQLARLEVFSNKVPAAAMREFYWGGNARPLVIRGDDGLYLQLIKTGRSPYEADNASEEPTIAVKVRTRRHILHSLESVFGAQPTYVVQEGKPIAFFRMALDYVGSQTDAHGMLVCHGDRGLMESVFLKQPKVATSKVQLQRASADATDHATNSSHHDHDQTFPQNPQASGQPAA